MIPIITSEHLLMRLGILAMQTVAIVWMVSLSGVFIETAHRAPHLAGGGLLLLIADTHLPPHLPGGTASAASG